MVNRIAIVGGKVYSNGEFVEATVVVEDGKISMIEKALDVSDCDEKIYADGKLVLPGAIDVHVHFRDPGYTHKEDFYTGTVAAAKGGVTTVIDMPNTNPPTNSISAIIDKIEIGERKSVIDFSIHSGIPDKANRLCDLPILGIPSVKIYSYEYKEIEKTIGEYMEFASKRKLNLIFSVHAESREIIERNRENLHNHPKNLDYHSKLRSPEAEYLEVKRFIELAERYGVPIHFVHISTKQAFDLIMDAKKSGLNITFEVTPHHILLHHKEGENNPFLKINPPLRSKLHQEYLLNNIDKIDMFASDHAPHTIEEKELGLEDIEKAPPGIPNVELMLPLVMDLASKGLIGYGEAIKKLSENPAKRFGLNGKGFLVEGYEADIVIFDPKREWVVKSEELLSKAKYTPFEGKIIRGSVEKTIVRGKIVYDEGEILAERGWGRYVQAWRTAW